MGQLLGSPPDLEWSGREGGGGLAVGEVRRYGCGDDLKSHEDEEGR